MNHQGKKEVHMKLEQLINQINYKIVGNYNDNPAEIEISSVVYDSRKIIKNCLFICIRGANADGHDYIQQAVEMGAAAVVVEGEVELSEIKTSNTVFLQVDNSRYAMAFIAAAYFGNPAERLKVIGVTGTKGKTTTTYLIKSILEKAGYQVGLIGTIETIIKDKHIPAKNTTPESYVLQ